MPVIALISIGIFVMYLVALLLWLRLERKRTDRLEKAELMSLESRARRLSLDALVSYNKGREHEKMIQDAGKQAAQAANTWLDSKINEPKAPQPNDEIAPRSRIRRFFED